MAAMGNQRGQAYAQDLRDRVLAAEGSIRQVAARFKVSELYVSRARSRKKRLGLDTPGEQRNHVRPKLAGLEHALAAYVAANTDTTLERLCAWAASEHHIEVSQRARAQRRGCDGRRPRALHPAPIGPLPAFRYVPRCRVGAEARARSA